MRLLVATFSIVMVSSRVLAGSSSESEQVLGLYSIADAGSPKVREIFDTTAESWGIANLSSVTLPLTEYAVRELQTFVGTFCYDDTRICDNLNENNLVSAYRKFLNSVKADGPEHLSFIGAIADEMGTDSEYGGWSKVVSRIYLCESITYTGYIHAYSLESSELIFEGTPRRFFCAGITGVNIVQGNDISSQGIPQSYHAPMDKACLESPPSDPYQTLPERKNIFGPRSGPRGEAIRRSEVLVNNSSVYVELEDKSGKCDEDCTNSLVTSLLRSLAIWKGVTATATCGDSGASFVRLSTGKKFLDGRLNQLISAVYKNPEDSDELYDRFLKRPSSFLVSSAKPYNHVDSSRFFVPLSQETEMFIEDLPRSKNTWLEGILNVIREKEEISYSLVLAITPKLSCSDKRNALACASRSPRRIELASNIAKFSEFDSETAKDVFGDGDVSVDLTTILIHELGHLQGIGHTFSKLELSYRKNIMAPSYSATMCVYPFNGTMLNNVCTGAWDHEQLECAGITLEDN